VNVCLAGTPDMFNHCVIAPKHRQLQSAILQLYYLTAFP